MERKMFKVDWEKASSAHHLPRSMVEQMVRLAYPDKKLLSYELIAGGCANLNIKILLQGDERPLILRVYLRDKAAAYREQKLSALLKATVPVPLTHYIGEVGDYRFAITEFIYGIPLRDLLLDGVAHDISAIMRDVGVNLSKIARHEFAQSGFFDEELNVIPNPPSEDYLVFAESCLKNEAVISVLAPYMILKISNVLLKYRNIFQDKNGKHLVHGDFDPANIFVDQTDGVWKVTGVLDWEFAFSGSYLWDIANMLRYAHKMPHEFQEAFLSGLTSSGITLPKNWRITVYLLNLLSLLDCLKRSESKNQPKKCADIRELIEYILLGLDVM